MKKKLLEQDYCPEKWNRMEKTCTGAYCSVCEVHLPDLTELWLGELVNEHLDSGKCVRLTDSQINFLSFYKKIRQTAAISSIVIGTSFFNYTYSQSVEEAAKNTDSCLVTGRVIFEDDKSISRNTTIYITLVGGGVYETKTDSQGNFAINLPKNSKVWISNLKKLESRKIKNRDTIHLGKNKIRREKRRMGWL